MAGSGLDRPSDWRTGRHRTDGFAVRRWLQAGAASAGMGAALFGFALLGPQPGVASADTAGESSPVSGATPSSVAAPDRGRNSDTGTRAERRAARAESRKARRGEDTEKLDRLARSAPEHPAATATSTTTAETAETSAADPVTNAAPRRLINVAPTVAPSQLSGQISGAITGTIGADDPEGDALTYRLRRAPREGSVQLNSDGTYAYTPGRRFDGVDTFRVAVIDGGPFRPWGTSAKAVINQGAISFDFTYTDGAQYWTADRREALQRGADNLMLFLVVTRPVELTYTVRAKYDTTSGSLASAGSFLTTGRRGFWPTVVERKLLTGLDANGAADDGYLTFNFGEPWALGDSVAAGEFDFTAVLLHEMTHTLGFSSLVSQAGDNGETSRPLFDRFIVTADGTRPISWSGSWNEAYDANLTGGSGGLYFGGANAVAAYGGPVPLYTPNPWGPGSSVSHLDDDTFTGANRLRMIAYSDPGPGIRVLSPVELGILKDLGYQVQSPPAAMAFVGLLVLGSKRRKGKVSR
ncbi:MAG: Ig-like domain-containing protein [Mycobacterium sp.]|nr:Ig-like domain-containing protein [Mycobacterium sp.]